MLHFHAVIHDDFEAGVAGSLRGLVMDYSELHPDDLRADFDRLLDVSRLSWKWRTAFRR